MSFAGIYLHIPFCRHKCPYCDFYSCVAPDRIEAYVTALCREMHLVRAPHLVFDTLYIGGGTPSLLSGDQIGRLVAAAERAYPLHTSCEMTIEVNPESIRADRLADYRAAGVNRISIGIQSFDNAQLSFLGRLHSAEQGRTAVGLARSAGFENVSLDLIYGLPQQTPAQWRDDLEAALALAPEHLSCYTLTYEPDTPLGRDCSAGRVTPLDEHGVARLFRHTESILSAAGFDHYEISNFARQPRYRSRHNCKYWQFEPYFGFGVSAHSYQDPVRWWNHAALDRYLQQIAKGALPIADREMLTDDQQLIEAIYLGLRTAAGLSRCDLKDRFKIDFNDRFGRLLADLEADGLALSEGDRVWLTLEGLVLLDSVTDRFIGCL